VACAPAAVDREVILARAQATERGMEGVLDSTLRRWFTPAALDRGDHPGVEHARRSLLSLDPLAFADGWRAIADHDVTDQLHRLDLPVTCLAGTQDVSSPPDQVRVIADHVEAARFVVIDAPHIAYLEQPAAVASAVAEHLDAWRASTR
jgi:3-oxoadipate enol-lactonase